MAAAAGRVITQATTMSPATPQRTALRRFVAPTPMMEVVIVCVVETGAPKPMAATYRNPAATLSATKPWAGSRSMTFEPRVAMIRVPPK